MAVSSINYQLRLFFSWWGEELTALMPESLLSLFRNGRPMQLFYTDETLRLVNHGRTGEEVHNNFLNGIDFDDPEQKRILAGASEIRLCLEKKKYLIKKVSLPIETEENLREVLAFEMDRQTPFKADQVYYDYVILGRDKQARSLEVILVLAPIDKLTYALEQLNGNDIVINAISPCEEHNGLLNRVNLNLDQPHLVRRNRVGRVYPLDDHHGDKCVRGEIARDRHVIHKRVRCKRDHLVAQDAAPLQCHQRLHVIPLEGRRDQHVRGFARLIVLLVSHQINAIIIVLPPRDVLLPGNP